MSQTSQEPYNKSIKIIFQTQIQNKVLCHDEIVLKNW
jgi:hypothetical protein